MFRCSTFAAITPRGLHPPVPLAGTNGRTIAGARDSARSAGIFPAPIPETPMVTRDRRIDAYIDNAADFARPILIRLRSVVHSACPEVVETLKWRMPSFEYKGLLCGMAAFQQHCTFGFWKHELVVGKGERAAMGSFGRITSLEDLPSKSELTRMVKKAMQLNDDGVKVVREKRAPKAIAMHPALKKALAGNAKARTNFAAFSPSQKREYLEWIAEAKGDDTRQRRLADAVAWIAQGKPRNWKYVKV
jgi:hypothetical protein